MHSNPSDLVTVREAPDPLSAEAIALVLRDAGIQAIVVQPPAPGLDPVMPSPSGKVPIRVHAADLTAARRVLTAQVEHSADLDWSEANASDPAGEVSAAPHRRRPPLPAILGWALAASIILLLLVTTLLMLLRLLRG